ncbi:TPA: hypothetical protein PKO72_004305 [Aeromonas hydrophila]|uniref:KAP family NTPase n=1 Tax=Aeromonas hydrophila TaxID=644 RepID=UPI001CCBA686|nr:KAP family NTPase [Aeromonas hydrophila]EHK5438655.1 hypothetical protein [Aeromonas hydrophila]UBQ50848.1 KAP family NTPase [Aeromonas hydrophila]HDI1215508.1 hypothetical protein [Aeromonas hydrophila]
MTKTISRYFDIITYSFLSWLIFSIASEIEIVKTSINNWRSIYSSIPYYLSIFTYYLAGMLTKSILINSGDFNYRHTFYNESIYRNKDAFSFFSIGLFDLKLKLKQFIINPPLKLSLLAFFAIIYSTNEIELRDYFTIEIACYLIGLNTPHFLKSIRQSLATKPPLDEHNEEPNAEHWHQYEKPILTLNQDRLNRGELVNRLCNVITSNENADTRGIAIIGPFGIGKSSVINMALSEIQMAFHSYIPCRINSWGTYSSEEQIQKYIIEQVINSLGKVTSTTSLSGLPSKYIHTLKGAQSLWLDILPIFDNHSSPGSQLAEIDNLLVNLKIKIIIIIEDLDRNKDAEAMLNSIAPLIDTLNENSSFRFILSIGQKLNNPEIINRICRYKEYISLDREHVQNSIKECLNKIVQMKKLTYKGNYKDFFSTTTSDKTIATRDALLSYITNPRELKIILRQMELDWNSSLHGCCDILDLFAITTLMHYEPILITSILNHNPSEISFTKLTEKNKEILNELSSAKSSEKIVNYFFDTTREDTKPENRLQSCRHDFNKYFQMIVARNRIDKEQREKEQSYFSGLFELNLLCKKNSQPYEIYTLTDELTYYKKNYDKFIYDYKTLYGKNSLIPTLILLRHCLLNKDPTKENRAQSDYFVGKMKGARVRNNVLAHRIIRDIVNIYLNQSLITLESFYSKLDECINQNYIPKPKINNVMLNFKEQHGNEETLNMHLIVATLDVIQFVMSKNQKQKNNKPKKRKYEFFVEWLIENESSFSMNIVRKIKEYKYQDDLSIEYHHMYNLKELIEPLANPIEKIEETI